MFSWFANSRRKKLIQEPFPPAWEDILHNNVAHYCMLDDAERTHLRELIQVFVAEKDWEGCGGLELTDEIRLTISAQACLLLLGLPHNYYQNVETIIVYPSTVVPPQRKLGFFETALAPIEDSHPIIGQAFQQGHVIIIWDAAPLTARPRCGTGLNTVTGCRHVPVNICASNMTPNTAGNLFSMLTARPVKLNSSLWPRNSSSTNLY